MELRLKLVVIFVIIACLGLSLFGAVSYTSARDLSTYKQIMLLHTFNKQILNSMRGDGFQPQFPYNVIDPTNPGEQSQYLAIFNDANQIVLELGNLAIKSEILSQLPFSITEQPNDGTFEIDQQHYIWATTPATDSIYTLLHAQRITPDDLTIFLNAMGAPLALTTIIVIWIGVWTSLSIASLFAKVNEQKAALTHKALHDDLTQLPNRASLIEAIDSAIKRAGDNTSLALCVIDLNHFKEINESLGHHCGDQLLSQIGSRLPTLLKTAECIARLGGDEFAILFSHAKLSTANQIAEKLLHALEPAFEIEGHSLYVSGTLGIAFYPQHAQDARTLAQRSEIAMYKAKAGNKHFAIYEKKHDQSSVERLALVHDLRTAIDDDLLDLYYQPKLNLQSNSIIGVEALSRWKHPTLGYIPPDQFILLAEKTGLIRPLTAWVLETAIQQCAEWRRRGLHLRMAVNLSASNLHDTRLELLISKLLSGANLPPASLELEITETAMMADPEQAMEILTSLDALGIRLSIDDFGTGYSSLAYLKRLPVDEIKIDKSFVLNMTNDDNDASIVLATLGLAHDLGLKVVAEGVEDQMAQDVLKSHGCDIAQGYHISKPLPAHDLDKLLAPARPIIVDPSQALPDDYRVILKTGLSGN